MMLICDAHIQESSGQPKLASKHLNRNIMLEFSGSRYTLQSSKMVVLASWPTKSKVLLLMSMWLRYTTTITLSMLLQQALWPAGRVQRAALLQNSHCVYRCTGLTVIQRFVLWVGIFLALWRVDGWVIIWSFLVRFWVSFCCFVYLIHTSFIFMHKALC
jgi:hypothetical protein